jgi:ribosomal protein S18 acetylase RimI-like enzyme
MTGYFALAPRTLEPDDAVGARVLLGAVLGVTPYLDRVTEVLARAERGDDPEHRALVIARDGMVAGLALFGEVAGAEGVVRIHGALLLGSVDVGDVGQRLIDAVVDTARASRSRLLVAELPDDPALGAMFGLLRAHGFVEESRVPDFYRDGVALVFLRRVL